MSQKSYLRCCGGSRNLSDTFLPEHLPLAACLLFTDPVNKHHLYILNETIASEECVSFS